MFVFILNLHVEALLVVVLNLPNIFAIVMLENNFLTVKSGVSDVCNSLSSDVVMPSFSAFL